MRREITELKAMMKRIAVTVSRMSQDASDIKRDASLLTSRSLTRQEFNKRMDEVMGELELSRRERVRFEDAYMLHERRLDQHDKRLARLEAR